MEKEKRRKEKLNYELEKEFQRKILWHTEPFLGNGC